MSTSQLITDISSNGIDFIKGYEQLRLIAYPDSKGVWTIGWGTIQYKNGQAVKRGDKITIQQALAEFDFEIEKKVQWVKTLTAGVPLTQSQFDACCSFTYNEGITAFTNSHLLHLIKQNPNDPAIFTYKEDEHREPIINSCEFLKWVYCDHKVLEGLVNRRAAEANLYRA